MRDGNVFLRGDADEVKLSTDGTAEDPYHEPRHWSPYRSKVLGRHFFREIAPCTATPEFKGSFVEFTTGAAPRVGFPYVFDFKFGAQEVEVELARASDPHRFYVCINRLKFRPPRPAFADVAAPRQAELVPGEEALGIRRDDG